jgi:hypothetical protein
MSIQRDQSSALDGTAAFERPTMGVLARRVPIRSHPAPTATTLGLLTAGATLGRSEQPVGRDGCPDGWYEVSPRGYLCLDTQTTTDPRHPTLRARGLLANRTATLPYPYATARRSSLLFEPDPDHQDGVRQRGRLSKGSRFAIVGSWETLDEYDQRQRLAMLTLGTFVPARDIEPVRLDSSIGLALDGPEQRLPLGFPLAIKTPSYRFSGTRPLPQGFLDAQGPVALTVKTRLFENDRYLLLTNDNYVAERDVAVARQRQNFPDFVATSTHWVDIDIAQGIIVMYDGEHPSYVTRTRGRPDESIQRGTAWVRLKQLTTLSSVKAAKETTSGDFDVPWVVELDSGVTLSTGLDAPGGSSPAPTRTIELHPEDAARLFRFLEPAVPEGWHAVIATDPKHEGSPVVLR